MLKTILYSVNFENAGFVDCLVTVKAHGRGSCMIFRLRVTGVLDCSVLV